MESKVFYEPPLTQVIELEQEGVVCASQTGTNGSPIFHRFKDEEEW